MYFFSLEFDRCYPKSDFVRPCDKFRNVRSSLVRCCWQSSPHLHPLQMVIISHMPIILVGTIVLTVVVRYNVFPRLHINVQVLVYAA